MRHAESVTFGGSALDRADWLRNRPERLAALQSAPEARLLPMWRGKPLVHRGAGGPRLAWVGPGARVLDAAKGPPVLLGLEGGDAAPAGRFAADVSDWEPPGLDESALTGFFDRTEQHYPGLPADQVFTELRAVMTQLTPREAELAATARALFNWHRTHGFCARCGARSEMTMAGWQRRCPGCGALHFPRTDPVVIMLITRGNSLLMGRSHPWPAGMYSLLAGFVEPGETVEGAVRREVAEEAGVQVGAVRYLASQPWPFPNSLMIGCRGEALSEALEIDPEELDDACWFTREQVLAVMSGENAEVSAAREGAIAHFLIRNWLADTLN
ncbi:NAD(+) diphosphatase [Rhodobacteraceae bacterium WD3A24]|nr:NAD(+) diphosphatase [Rhodobacteraceae bacterium WD3A24]